MLISPSLPSASWSFRRFFMKSFILRSCSISFPSSRHSASNACCSLSACAFSFAISFTARSRASYALLEISMIFPISFFFSCSSHAPGQVNKYYRISQSLDHHSTLYA